MAIDHVLRSQGVGASEIASVLNLSKYGDAFSVYASKVGAVERAPSTDVQLRGKRFERIILEWHGERIGKKTEWFDRTIVHPTREWQLCSPDGFVLADDGQREYGVDSKTAGFSRDEWGEDNTDHVPEHVALQCAWSCSVLDMPHWDVALMTGIDDLHAYRVYRDMELETILLEQVEHFWRCNVLARVPPAPTGSPAATDAIRRMFHKDVTPLRCATADEYPLIEALKQAKAEKKRAELACAEAENRIKIAIGSAGGLLAGNTKITWTKNADTIRPDYRAIARELGLRLELVKPIVEYALLQQALAVPEGAVVTAGAASLIRAEHVHGGVKTKMPDWWNQTMPELEKAYDIVAKVGGRVLRPPRSWANGDDE
jgi:predicted phage-related endonuclease